MLGVIHCVFDKVGNGQMIKIPNPSAHPPSPRLAPECLLCPASVCLVHNPSSDPTGLLNDWLVPATLARLRAANKLFLLPAHFG